MKLQKRDELNNLKVQTRRKEKIKKENVDKKWILQVTLIAFFLSFFMSLISENILANVPLLIAILITIIFIMLGILFDIIGVAVTTSDEKVFHSMNSRKVKGANIAVKFKKNSDKVSSFCCDVVGDVCGVISGSAGVTITVLINKSIDISIIPVGLIVTALIASFTIGGKAIGKSFAINKSNIILYKFAKFISNFYKG
ncbi:MAG: hypothetical protein J6B89_01565 [Bacilli bacterium]|nr:hypothetical protein [Bacilli bacterium]